MIMIGGVPHAIDRDGKPVPIVKTGKGDKAGDANDARTPTQPPSIPGNMAGIPVGGGACCG